MNLFRTRSVGASKFIAFKNPFPKKNISAHEKELLEQGYLTEEDLEVTPEVIFPHGYNSAVDHKKSIPVLGAELSCAEDVAFIFHDGVKVRSLGQLIVKIASLNEDELGDYITSDRNDFANWIEDVFSNDALAKKIRKVKSKDELIKTLIY